jgi:hypothetical protein
MPPSNLADLLKLPADERAELAMALWESLSDHIIGCRLRARMPIAMGEVWVRDVERVDQ